MRTIGADIVVLGSGPTGAAATWRLAMAGADVLCVERGHRLDPDAIGRGEPDWELRREGPLNPNPNIRRHRDDQPIDDAESPIKPMIASTVGGTSHHWSTHVPRFRPEDFRTKSLDGVGEDWPIAYEDLAPYYEINEAMTGLAYLPGDPSGPVRQVPSKPLPSIGPHGRRVAQAFDALGWHWWVVDYTAGTEPDLPPCTHAGPCDIGCPSRRRASSDVNYLAAALKAGARLETGLRAYRLETDGRDRVTALLCRSDEGDVRVEANRFVICGNGLATPWLLLNSRDDRHPQGLANSSGLVGRNLMLHPHARMDGIFEERLGTWLPGKTIGITTHEFFAAQGRWPFKRGFKMQLGGGPSPLAIALGAIEGRRLPFGAAHHEMQDRLFDHAMSFTVCIEDAAEEHNRIALSETLRDQDGNPAPRMVYRLSADSRACLDFALARAEEVLRKAGAVRTQFDPLKAQAGFHLMGTARMGRDAARSVVGPDGRSHDIGNLYVADASVFVTASSLNPTATAQAFALRVADGILGRMK